MKMNHLIRFSVACIALCSLVGTAHAQTSITFLGSGTSVASSNTISASATFTILGGGQLQIDIKDTSTWDYNKADFLDSVVFNLAPTVTVTTTENSSTNVSSSIISGNLVSTAPGANLTTTVPTDITGSWVWGDMTTPVNDPDTKYRWGVSSAGMSNSGATASTTSDGKEQYLFSGFSVGDGGDDYALMPENATKNVSGNYVNGGGSGGNLDVVKGTVRVTVSGLTNLTTTSQITGMAFLYGSGSTTQSPGVYNEITGSAFSLPEPSSFVFVGMALVAGGAFLKRSRS